VESGFEQVPGVVEAVSSYSGGDTDKPTYRQVSAGNTGHTESIQVYYDPRQVSYAQLLSALWKQIDPTDADGQFSDRGRQYRPAIFYRNAEEIGRIYAAESVTTTWVMSLKTGLNRPG